jgi:hypothetical protein
MSTPLSGGGLDGTVHWGRKPGRLAEDTNNTEFTGDVKAQETDEMAFVHQEFPMILRRRESAEGFEVTSRSPRRTAHE